MKTLMMVTCLLVSGLANAADCSVAAKLAVNKLNALNGVRNEKVTSVEVLEDKKYTTTFQVLTYDSFDNRFVYEVDTKKDCTVVKIEVWGET